MIDDIVVALFITTSGLTASGIVANLYRLLVGKMVRTSANPSYLAVMVVAGPSVLLDHAMRSYLKKECSAVAFWIAMALSGYWSLAIGLFVVECGLAFR